VRNQRRISVISLFVKVLIRTIIQSAIIRANPTIFLKRTKCLYSESKRLSILLAVDFATRKIKL